MYPTFYQWWSHCRIATFTSDIGSHLTTLFIKSNSDNTKHQQFDIILFNIYIRFWMHDRVQALDQAWLGKSNVNVKKGVIINVLSR